VSIRRPLYLAEVKVAITPFEGGHRVGGTMELSGINTILDPRRLANVRRSAESVIPGILDGAEQAEWVGMRPMTPDGLPVMGRLSSSHNVYIASGHQMLGMTLAPASGKAMAELILGPNPGQVKVADLSPFDPGRF
jgi:D-amino-acid dehydrogenase